MWKVPLALLAKGSDCPKNIIKWLNKCMSTLYKNTIVKHNILTCKRKWKVHHSYASENEMNSMAWLNTDKSSRYRTVTTLTKYVKDFKEDIFNTFSVSNANFTGAENGSSASPVSHWRAAHYIWGSNVKPTWALSKGSRVWSY